MPKRGWVIAKNRKNVARSRKGRDTFYRTTPRPIGSCRMCKARILLDQCPSNLCSTCLRSKFVTRAIESSSLFTEELSACSANVWVFAPPIPLWVYSKLLPIHHPLLWNKVLDEISNKYSFT